MLTDRNLHEKALIFHKTVCISELCTKILMCLTESSKCLIGDGVSFPPSSPTAVAYMCTYIKTYMIIEIFTLICDANRSGDCTDVYYQTE